MTEFDENKIIYEQIFNNPLNNPAINPCNDRDSFSHDEMVNDEIALSIEEIITTSEEEQNETDFQSYENDYLQAHDQLENRYGVYRTNDSPEHGEVEVLRVAAVNDCLEAERYMHNLIRQNCKCADNHSKKSKDKNDWYIDDCNMFYIEEAFEETIHKYGMDNDKFVEKYDLLAKDELQEHLIEIDHYRNRQLKPSTYYIHE